MHSTPQRVLPPTRATLVILCKSICHHFQFLLYMQRWLDHFPMLAHFPMILVAFCLMSSKFSMQSFAFWTMHSKFLGLKFLDSSIWTLTVSATNECSLFLRSSTPVFKAANNSFVTPLVLSGKRQTLALDKEVVEQLGLIDEFALQ